MVTTTRVKRTERERASGLNRVVAGHRNNTGWDSDLDAEKSEVQLVREYLGFLSKSVCSKSKSSAPAEALMGNGMTCVDWIFRK